jgi:hypothetical protein
LNYPPPLLNKTAAEYRSYFETNYCHGTIRTFDGIEVRFRKSDFNHCFFESANAKDDTFSLVRAERILWIKTALQDPNSERYIGWNKKKKRYDKNRRVTVVKGNYVVVIALIDNQKADFVTAYIADSKRTLEMIRRSPEWT